MDERALREQLEARGMRGLVRYAKSEQWVLEMDDGPAIHLEVECEDPIDFAEVLDRVDEVIVAREVGPAALRRMTA